METPTLTARALLERFAAALAAGDSQAAGALWADDAVYDEVPAFHFEGRAAIQAFLDDFVARHYEARLTFRRVIEAGDGEVLAAEWEWRYLSNADQHEHAFEGMSMVRARNGSLTEWRGFSARRRP